MTKLKGSLWAKAIAALLILVTLAAACLSALGIALLERFDAYSDGYDKARDAVLDEICLNRSYEAAMNLTNYYTMAEDIYPDSGFCFTVEDSDGKVIFDNLSGRATAAQSEAIDFRSSDSFFENSAHTTYVNTEMDGRPETETAAVGETIPTVTPTPAPTATPAATTATTVTDDEAEGVEAYDEYDVTDDTVPYERKTYTLRGYLLADIPDDDDASLALEALDMGYSMRYGLFVIAIVSAAAALLLFIFLMSAAGHKADGEVSGTFVEKIPFDLFTAIIILAEVLVGLFVSAALDGYEVYWMVRGLVAGVGIAVFLLIGLYWCMSWAVRIKLHTALSGCICYKILAWLWRGIKKLFGIIAEDIKGLPLIKRAALITFAILVVEFFFIVIAGDDTGDQLFGWFFERAILVALLIYALIGMKKLLAAGKEIANGNMNYVVDTSKMRGVVKEHGEDLNNISAGLNKAMAERMKSERFKTELITNVSHDIRTPLTSIINYVDLLAKENPDSDTEREYIEVLERQSARLKKLIDDLIEASKASTGNLTVNPEHCEMGVLLGQIAGEYTEKLEKANLELVLTVPEESIAIMADGRHMWRIFDNLLNNACKYSQSGTRVYLTLDKKDGRASVSIKNISKTQLNISGDELMERFVRGDSARNTEGSGLGLSIARSLTQLQNGEMSIDIDGDLFKVTLSFALIK